VFLLGHWKDYDELETSLSMPELTATLKAMYSAESRKNKFMASLQGVNLDSSDSGDTSGKQPSTLKDIQARAMERLSGGNEKSSSAVKYGFTPDMGVAYDIIRSGE
jgi:hypothetical protein